MDDAAEDPPHRLARPAAAAGATATSSATGSAGSRVTTPFEDAEVAVSVGMADGSALRGSAGAGPTDDGAR
jgi:hypothetical protein